MCPSTWSCWRGFVARVTAKLNLKIIDVPIHYFARTYGTTNISRFKHGWLLLRMSVFAMRKMKFVE